MCTKGLPTFQLLTEVYVTGKLCIIELFFQRVYWLSFVIGCRLLRSFHSSSSFT